MEQEKILDFLQEQRDQAPDDLQHYFISFEEYFERKLWHELTDLLVDFYNTDASAPQRTALFHNFITKFADKINQLKLATIGLSTTAAYKDQQEKLDFLTALAKRVDGEESQDAYVFVLSCVAASRLELGQTEEARKDIDKCEGILDNFDSVETVVHARFYLVKANHHQAQHEFAEYYRTMLLYLACVDVPKLAANDRLRIAHDLSVAALVSDSIYNFGELLLHPILDSLHHTKHAWLRDLLFAFNRGDLQAAHGVLQQHIDANSLLKKHQTFLFQKISLAALTQLVFSRPPQDRSMTFATIHQETKVEHDEIEHLLMKAFSLGLLRGKIDQVTEVAQITWVQPKVLDRQGIQGMRTRLQDWDSGVERLGNWIEKVGQEVWAS